MDWVLCDFETASACDLKKAGAWRYAECPTTEVLCLFWSINGSEPIGWLPGMPADELLCYVERSDVIFIAHNAGFEKAIWRNIMVSQYGWPDIPNSRWHDTMAACAHRGLPLEMGLAAGVLRLPAQKDDEGRRAVLDLSKFAKSGYVKDHDVKLARVYPYCAQDVRAEVSLHQRLGWLPTRERNVWLLDQRINERGVRLDLDYVQACIEIVGKSTIPLAAEFKELTGGLEFTQVAKIGAWCKAQGAELPDLRKETLAAILGAGIDGEEDVTSNGYVESASPSGVDVGGRDWPPAVFRVLEIRQLVGSAAVKKLPRMLACVGADGRARGIIQYHGAAQSGRFAGRLFQPHNFPILTPMEEDEAMDVDKVVSAIMTRDPAYVSDILGLPPVQGVVSALRHAIVSAENRLLTSADYAGIEMRILLAISGQRDKVELIASGASPYCDMGGIVYGYPITKRSHPVEYDIGKHGVLGLGYGLGWKEFKRRYAKNQPDEFSQRVVTTYRKEWAPCVPDFWYELEKASTKAVWDGGAHEAYGIVFQLHEEWLTERLPSGRLMWYFNPKKTRRPMPWDPDDIRPGWSYEGMKLGQWQTIHTFGGLLTGITIQGIARDLLVDAVFKCEKENMPLCMTVHDENVTEPLIADASEEVLSEIMLDVEPWARQLDVPLNVSTWSGSRYRK